MSSNNSIRNKKFKRRKLNEKRGLAFLPRFSDFCVLRFGQFNFLIYFYFYQFLFVVSLICHQFQLRLWLWPRGVATQSAAPEGAPGVSMWPVLPHYSTLASVTILPVLPQIYFDCPGKGKVRSIHVKCLQILVSWKEWRQRSRRQYQRAQQGRTGCIDVLRSVFGHKNSASRGYGVLRLLRKLICFGKGWLPLLSISRGDAVVKEMEKKHIARVDARMDKEREMQVKNSPQYICWQYIVILTIYRESKRSRWRAPRATSRVFSTTLQRRGLSWGSQVLLTNKQTNKQN